MSLKARRYPCPGTGLLRFALGMILALATSCSSLPALRPEPGVITSEGVTVQLKVEGEALALQIWNLGAVPLQVMPAAIKLYKDKIFLTPEYADILRTISPGSSLPLRLRFILDGISLSEMEGSSLHLDTALARNGQRLEFAPFKLVPSAYSETVREGPHLSVVGGYSYNYFYRTSVQGGFAELRYGGTVDALEFTVRLRVQFARTEVGRLVVSETVGFGLLGRIHPRVRLGFEVSALPLSWLIVKREEGHVQDIIFDAAPELRIDLMHTKSEILFLTARPGFVVGLASRPAFISPNILIGLGFGFDQPVLRRRAR